MIHRTYCTYTIHMYSMETYCTYCKIMYIYCSMFIYCTFSVHTVKILSIYLTYIYCIYMLIYIGNELITKIVLF